MKNSKLLGYTKSGRPIWMVAGGSEDAGHPADAGAAEESEAPETPEADNSSDDLAALRKQLADARAEAAKTRVNAKKQAADDAVKDMTAKLAQALGLTKEGDAAPNPSELTGKLEAVSSQYRTAQLELSIYRSAAKQGVDASAITDSRAFMKTIEALDPESDSFDTDLAKAMTEAAEKNPRLKISGQAPVPKSGAPIPGGTGERAKRNVSLNSAVAAKLGGS